MCFGGPRSVQVGRAMGLCLPYQVSPKHPCDQAMGIVIAHALAVQPICLLTVFTPLSPCTEI